MREELRASQRGRLICAVADAVAEQGLRRHQRRRRHRPGRRLAARRSTSTSTTRRPASWPPTTRARRRSSRPWLASADGHRGWERAAGRGASAPGSRSSRPTCAFTRAYMVEFWAAGDAARERWKERRERTAGLLRVLHERARAEDPAIVPVSDTVIAAVVGGVNRVVISHVLERARRAADRAQARAAALHQALTRQPLRVARLARRAPARRRRRRARPARRPARGGRCDASGSPIPTPPRSPTPSWAGLNVATARAVVPYDVALTRPSAGTPAGDGASNFDAWITNAAAAGVAPLVAFQTSLARPEPGRALAGPLQAGHARVPVHVPERAPARAVERAELPQRRDPQPARPQPGAGGRYYTVLRSTCPGCTVARRRAGRHPRRSVPDPLPEGAGLRPGRAVWGVHAHTDANQFQNGTDTSAPATSFFLHRLGGRWARSEDLDRRGRRLLPRRQRTGVGRPVPGSRP